MANITFDALPGAVSATAGDIYAADQAGTSVKITGQQLIDLIKADFVTANGGNPNGTLAGVTYDLCIDTSTNNFYVCTSSGTAATAVWTLIGAEMSLAVAAFLNDPTSANLAAAVTNDTGSGELVFAISPSLITPAITGGSINGAFIGATSASTGVFTNLTVTNDLSIVSNLFASSESGITASTTQTQGEGPLTKDINVISVCANANDTVTLHPAAAGLSQLVINNGASTLQVFPTSGDNLGAGADTATTITAGSLKRFTAYDSTNWVTE